MPKPYTPNDRWSQRAREEGFRARSVYKLQELDQRFHLLKSGMRVLDIGAAPGSWLQYVSGKIGSNGLVLGLDLQDIKPIADNVKTAICDINDQGQITKTLQDVGIEKVDLMLSDIAPNTSGIKDVDQWRSIELSQMVVDLSKKYLRPHGTLVMKVFRGADFDEFLRDLKLIFTDIRTKTVQASRDRSREVYVVCRS